MIEHGAFHRNLFEEIVEMDRDFRHCELFLVYT